MAKKIGLSLGNREIKPAQVIEETHASPAPEAEPKTEDTGSRKAAPVISRRKRAKKDWVVKSSRFEREEYEKIEAYMEENETNFNALIRSMLEEKGIL